MYTYTYANAQIYNFFKVYIYPFKLLFFLEAFSVSVSVCVFTCVQVCLPVHEQVETKDTF